MVTTPRSSVFFAVFGIKNLTGRAKKEENRSTKPESSATRISPLKKQIEPPSFKISDTVSAGVDNIASESAPTFPVIIPQTVPMKIRVKQIQPTKILSPFSSFYG